MEPNADDNTKPVDQPVVQPVEQPVEPPAEQPTEQSTEQPATQPTEPPVEQPAEATTPEATTPEVSTPEPTTDNAPTDDSSAKAPTENPSQKSKKPLIITLSIILVAAIIGVIIWLRFFPSNPSGDGDSDDGVQGSSSQSDANPDYELGEFSDFDLVFLKLENENTNTIYSPLSIKYALAMLSDASDGDSYSQIYNLIGNYTPKTYTNNEHRALANAMFIRDSAKSNILSSYTDTIGSKFNASVIYDPFASVSPINTWISGKTLGIINNMLDDSILSSEDYDTDFLLVNALAIDMNWNNQLQCLFSGADGVKCMGYWVRFAHEKYSDHVSEVMDNDSFDKIELNGQEVKAAKIGATANRYDIINELGEDYIRSTVLAAYDEYVEENEEDEDFDIDTYMEQLSANFGKQYSSTDFYFYESENEKVFAKDLQEYDGSVLQYVGIMPKDGELSTYINTTNAEKIGNLIGSLKDASQINNYKDGVVTKIKAHIPFFNYDYELPLKDDLQELGVTDVFLPSKANLGKLTTNPEYFINNAKHKANIDFSNDGIRAAAATVVAGGRGAAMGGFDYKWDVPVEEIDLTFDKPFLFLIRDKSTGEVWFVGTFYNS